MKQPAVYMMTNKRNGAIYTGVTSNLIRRVYEHRNNLVDGYTKKYGCKSLVFFEIHNIMESAIKREKKIKASTRNWKIVLIEEKNPEWIDLYEEISK